MFRSLRKAAQSLSDSIDTAFSNAPPSHTAFVNTILSFDTITLRLGSVFAEGGYSFIHKAYLHPSSTINTSNQYYAVKRISCSDSQTKAQANHEAQILSQLTPHPNIVDFFGIVFHQDHAFIAMQLIDGGLLSQMLSKPSRPQPLTVLKDITTAIVHLHSQHPPVASRDLKLENVLYDRFNKCYKLCDLGSAVTKTILPTTRPQILSITDDIEANCTAMYRAPEIADLYSKKFICEKVDVWALGCIWYALLYNKLPFDGQSSLQITKGIQNLPKQPTHPPEYITLLHAMLEVDPARRVDSFVVLEAILMFQGNNIDPQLKQLGINLRKERAKDFQKDNQQIVMSPTAEELFPNRTFHNTSTFPVNNYETEHQRSLNNQHVQRIMPPQSVSTANPLISFDDVEHETNNTTTKQTLLTDSLNTGSSYDPPMKSSSTSWSKPRVGSSDHNIGKAASQEEGWADFESAFNDGNTSSLQMKTEPKQLPKTIQTTSNSNMSFLSSLQSVDQEFNSMTTQRDVATTFAELNLKPTTPSNTANTTVTNNDNLLIDFADFSSSQEKTSTTINPSNLTSSSSKQIQQPQCLGFTSSSSRGEKKSGGGANFSDLIDFN